MQDPIPSLFVKPTQSSNDKSKLYIWTGITYGYSTHCVVTKNKILTIKLPLIHKLREICYN
jgi:hypothetical protein